MKIAITGASGYIGTNIIEELKKQKFSIIPLNRQLLYGDPNELAKVIKGVHAIINLAGAAILQRWTKKNKIIIYNSRIVTTRNLIRAIHQLPPSEHPKVFISASATGIYRENMNHDGTSSNFANNFAARVIDDWEGSLADLDTGIRLAIFRTGIVLGKNSQTMQKLLPFFKFGLGGKIGNGKQPFPFIHIDDVVKAYVSAIENESFFGIYNLVAPDQVTNLEFTRELAKQLNKPAIFNIPPFILKLIFGKAASIIHKNAFVTPRKLIGQHYQFTAPTLEACIQKIVK